MAVDDMVFTQFSVCDKAINEMLPRMPVVGRWYSVLDVEGLKFKNPQEL